MKQKTIDTRATRRGKGRGAEWYVERVGWGVVLQRRDELCESERVSNQGSHVLHILQSAKERDQIQQLTILIVVELERDRETQTGENNRVRKS